MVLESDKVTTLADEASYVKADGLEAEPAVIEVRQGSFWITM